MPPDRTRPVAGRAAALIAWLVLLALTAAACGGDAGDPDGRIWTLTQLDGAPTATGTLVTISFVDGEVTGSTGCNTYSSTATWSDGDLSIDPGIVATRRVCDAPIMEQEQRFLDLLLEADAYEVDGDELRLFDGDTAFAVFTADAP
jgi:heat shock protein HslJ